jgi:hypothetical protein
VDFIILNGNFVLDNIYTVNNINNLLNDIGLHVGESLVQSAQTDQSRPANRTIVFRNELLRRVIGKARPLSNRLSTVLPESIKQNLRDRLYVPRDQKLKYIFDNEYTQAFIRDYYAEDISLYEQVNHDVRSVS